MSFRPFAALLPLLVAGAVAAPAGAATYCVHQSGTCAAGTLDRQGDLKLAIAQAAQSDDADVIQLGPGEYVGKFVYVGAGPLEIVGAGRDQTTLKAPAGTADVVMNAGRAKVSHLHVRLASASSWVGVRAADGGVLDDIAVDAPAGSERLGVVLRGDAQLLRSAVTLGNDDTGVGARSIGEDPQIADSVVDAGIGIHTRAEDHGVTHVQRSTITGAPAVRASGSVLELGNTVLRGRPGADSVADSVCDEVKRSMLTGDHVTIVGNGAKNGATAECPQDGPAATISFGNTVVAGTEHAFARRGRLLGAASVAFAFSALHPAGSTDTGDGSLLLESIVDAEPGFAPDGEHLAPGSPLVDAGDPRFVSTELDRDGNPRVVGERQDIGAFELDPSRTPLPAPPAAPGDSGLPSAPGAGPDIGTGVVAPAAAVSDADLLAGLKATLAGRRGTRYAHRFLLGGTLTIRWTKGGRVLARAKLSRASGGPAVFRVKPTRRGRRVLRRAHRTRIVVRGTFAPTGRRAVRATRRARVAT